MYPQCNLLTNIESGFLIAFLRHRQTYIPAMVMPFCTEELSYHHEHDIPLHVFVCSHDLLVALTLKSVVVGN